MSPRLICKRCGLPVTRWLDGWKHASGGALGVTPAHRRHTPEPIEAPADDSAQVIAMLRDIYKPKPGGDQ